MFLLLFLEVKELVVKIEAFLDDKSKACEYITNQKLPRKSKINQFKNEYGYLIEGCFYIHC